MKRVRAVVTGRVQGVCFRAFTRERARGLGVSGFVRNLPDGSVEIVAEGGDGDVEELLRWVSRGPPRAWVSNLEVSEKDPTGDGGDFRIEF
ncbi:MAG: hypothetical protein AVO35_07545 [Candidatus Aegiribacteria sp. MLS_C]|nr:MAG: hypothetical protein AVO35_07545 [Candidatus Aegiribacteria sp. MLS_C]